MGKWVLISEDAYKCHATADKVLGYGYLTPSFIIVLEGLLGHGWAAPPVILGALVTAAGLLVMGVLKD
jgi:hypothetical protein